MLLTERGLGGNDPDLEVQAPALAQRPRPKGAGGEGEWRSGGSKGRAPKPAQAPGGMIAKSPSPSPSPTACRAAATHPASNGNRSAAAASGSTRPRRLARSEWLAVAEVAGAASGARILSAAAIEAERCRSAVRRRDRDLHRGPLRPGDCGDQRHQGAQARLDPAILGARSSSRPGGDRGRTARRCPPPRPCHLAMERKRRCSPPARCFRRQA